MTRDYKLNSLASQFLPTGPTLGTSGIDSIYLGFLGQHFHVGATNKVIAMVNFLAKFETKPFL